MIMETTIDALKNDLGKEFIRIEYQETDRWIYSRWLGDVTVEDVKQGAEKILDQVKQHSCPNVLNDNRELVGSWDEATPWVQQDWMPRAIAAGLQKFAHIISPDIFAAMSAEEMNAKIAGFEMRIFEDETEAKAWLKS